MRYTDTFYKQIIYLIVKTVLLLTIILFVPGYAECQLFVQSAAQTSGAGTGGGVPMPGTPGANVIFTSAGKVNPPFGTGNMPCTNGYSGFTTPTGITSYSTSGPAIEITLAPAAGFVLSATGISSKLRYSATGPANAVYAYSIDGGTTWINNGTISMPQSNCQSGTVFNWNFPCSVMVGVSQTFKFRIYFFNATGPTGTTQIENLTVNGTAVACTAPTATISGTTTICGGQNTNITFNGTPSSTVTYTINGGPNQTIALGCLGTAVVNTGTLASTTTYSLVSAGFGGCSQSLSGSAVVTVVPPISSAVISGTASICSGGTTNLSVAITGGSSPYTIVYSNGSTNTTINNYISGTPIPVSPAVNTTYTLVSVTSVAGCSSMSGSATVTITSAPTAATLSGTATICSGSNTNLSVAITGGTSPYTVVYFDGVSNTTVNSYTSGSAITVTPSATTTYSLVSVTSAAGCPGTGLSGTPIVTVRPSATTTISGTVTVCQGAASPNISFTNPQSLPVTVTYNINGGAPQTLNVNASSTGTVAAPTGTSGTFVYNLVGIAYQSAPTCSAVITGQSATVTVNSLYSSAVLSGTATICSGNSASLVVNITGGVSPYTIVYSDGSTNTTINNYINGSAIPVTPVSNTNYALVSVSGTGGCGGSGMSGTASITVSAAGTWLGVNTNWNDPLNWCDGNIPGSTTDVIIPSGVSFYPVITTTDPKSRNMTIAAGANMSITATGIFSFAGTVANSGTITNNGTIVLNGTTGAQNFPGTGIITMNHLTINNAFGVNLNKSMNIAGTLTLTNGIFTVGANTLTINNPIAGTPNNLSANNASSVTIAGTAAGVNLPASVSQLKNLTVSNSSGTVLQGNLNIATLLFISTTAGIVDADINTLNGAGNLQMSGGNLYLAKNGVVLPELTGSYTLTGGTVTFNGVGFGTDAQTVRPVNYFNLSSAATGDRILSNTGTIAVSNIFTPFTNLYTVTGSTVNFNKTNIQNIPSFTYYNLTVSGGNFTKTLTGDIGIKGVLTFALNTKLAIGNFNATLKSDINNTATVATMPTANAITYGTGRFIVERYIPTGITHPKSWQFLAVPVNTTQTIKEAWQEGATGGPTDNPNPGYGTQLTSNLAGALGLGFDFYTPAGPTIKTYNPTTNAWQSVTGTSLSITNNKGYMLFVRGDRSVTAYNQPAVPVTLRAKGKIYSPGTDAPPSTTVATAKLESVGNPYAAAIDFTNVAGSSTGIDTKYYVWDPLLPGSYGYGGYQTISSTNSYMPIPGGTANYSTGVPYTKIQPGQAFFVYSTPGGSVSFAESNKTTGNQLLFRSVSTGFNQSRQRLQSSLYTASGLLADGNAVITDSLFDDNFEANDAIKLSNFGENFGISIPGNTLALNARPPFNEQDTIFYKMAGLRQQGYQLHFIADNLSQSGVVPFLIDKWNNSEHPVSTTDSTVINFDITADPLSADTGRFFIVFKRMQPVDLVSIKLKGIITGNKTAQLEWKVENEKDVDHYELEHGQGTAAMNNIFSKTAEQNNGTGVSYGFIDNSLFGKNNFYRVKMLMTDGRIFYSNTISLEPVEKNDISIYPNPIENKMLNIDFGSMEEGNVELKLFDVEGKSILNNWYSIKDDHQLHLQLSRSLAAGTYYLKIVRDGVIVFSKPVIVR